MPPWRDVYIEHPIPPATAKDPLAGFEGIPPVPEATDLPRLGFAAYWETIPQRTLSGSAWHLRNSLRELTDTVDIGVEFPFVPRMVLKALHTRHRGGRLTTSWNNSRLTDAYIAQALRSGTRRKGGERGLDAVVTVDCIATMPEPYFVFYDSSWDALISSVDSLEHYATMRRLTRSNVLRRRDRQLAIYERATGIIAWSHWLARSIVEQSGVSPEKVHVIHPAGGTKRAQVVPGRSSRDPRRKLLYIGRVYESYDFCRKGGDLVVEALEILRRDYDPQITLTMVGMEKWPLPGEMPSGINFAGVVTPTQIAELYQTHDVFVMPSRAEPFGLVFAEALSWGMPCVARNAYAMPEVITPGVSGALIEKDDANELAATIAAVLADDDLYKQCEARASQIAEYFSWDRNSREVLQFITCSIR